MPKYTQLQFLSKEKMSNEVMKNMILLAGYHKQRVLVVSND